jgi:hypothetical protein
MPRWRGQLSDAPTFKAADSANNVSVLASQNAKGASERTTLCRVPNCESAGGEPETPGLELPLAVIVFFDLGHKDLRMPHHLPQGGF